ncbi:MAG: hypothetical protein JWN87_3359 [Frankiales bacterium]|nr:hypothetical protein [Frankiales bacterium]
MWAAALDGLGYRRRVQLTIDLRCCELMGGELVFEPGRI